MTRVTGALGRGISGAARARHRELHDPSGGGAGAHGRAHVGDRGADGRPVHRVRAARAAVPGDAADHRPAAGRAALAHAAHEDASQLGH